MNKRKDSIASVEKQKQEAVRKVAESKIAQVTAANSDSANIEKAKLAYGSFFNSAIGENKITLIENNVLKIGVSNKGGRMVSCELKKYHTYNNKPLTLIDKDSSAFGIVMNFENRNINTDSLYFSPTLQGSRLSMRASVNENQYI
jgi:YidC/Oxa1 family membrane protein insertase